MVLLAIVIVVVDVILLAGLANVVAALRHLKKVYRLADIADGEIDSLKAAIKDGESLESLKAQDLKCRKAVDLARETNVREKHFYTFPVEGKLTMKSNFRDLWDRYWELHLQVEVLSVSREGANA